MRTFAGLLAVCALFAATARVHADTVPATYAIGATGGHCDDTRFPPSIKTPGTAIANGPDELRAMVRKLRKYGAEVIKFCGTPLKELISNRSRYSLEHAGTRTLDPIDDRDRSPDPP
ncbi:MAG TPA: hypothetical protein VII35_00105 [Steroidobacteraceae bacterium]